MIMYCTACSYFYITCFLANWLLPGKVKYTAVLYPGAVNKLLRGSIGEALKNICWYL